MSKTIKYIGQQDRWSELAITGKQSTWRLGQQDERSDAEALQLLRSGQFDQIDTLDERAIQGLVAGAVRTAASLAADILCNDTSGAMRDRSGGGRHLVPGSGATNAFANSGYFTSTAGSGGHGFIPASTWSVDMAVDSFFISFGVKMAAPGANQNLLGFSNGSTAAGVYFSARQSSAAILPVIAAGGAGYSGVTGYPASVVGTHCDNTDHHIALAYDAPSRTVYYWVDGAIKLVIPNCVNPGASSVSTLGLALGAANDNGGGAVTAVAAQFRNLRLMKWAGAGLPLNIGALAYQSWANPQIEMTAQYVAGEASKRLSLAWIGQSNESGSSDIPDYTIGGVGSPQRDSITATGLTSVTPATNSSWHCRLSRLLGERGVWLDTINTARGTTSITQHWCGQYVGWGATTTYGLGAYMVAAGKVYKLTAIAAAAMIGSSSGTEPTWPGAGTVVDGDLTWTYQRAATGADVIGTVLTESNPLFDPNGYFAAISTSLAARAVGDKAVAISIGQTDKTLNTTQAQFQAGYESAIAWARARGWKVLVGFTCNGTTTGLNAWLSGTGQPAKTAALATYAGDSQVLAGADLLAALGAIGVSTVGIGLRADQLHLNSFGRDAAAAAWSQALQAAGY